MTTEILFIVLGVAILSGGMLTAIYLVRYQARLTTSEARRLVETSGRDPYSPLQRSLTRAKVSTLIGGLFGIGLIFVLQAIGYPSREVIQVVFLLLLPIYVALSAMAKAAEILSGRIRQLLEHSGPPGQPSNTGSQL